MDDSPVDRRLVAHMTASRGFEVVEAPDGESALELARARLPDVVVLDIVMPDRDGLWVLAHIHDERPHLPVVIVSGTGDADQMQSALQLGAVSFVKKPVVPEELRFVLDRLRQRAEEEQELSHVLPLVGLRETRITFSGHATDLPRIVTYLARELRSHYPGYDVPLSDIKLALYEALANAAEHGNLEISFGEKSTAMQTPGGLEALVRSRREKPDLAGRRVHVTALYHPDRVEYRVRDEGRGFDPEAYSAARALADTSALHGRGLALIRHYMEDVCWNEDGSEIRMACPLAPRRRNGTTTRSADA